MLNEHRFKLIEKRLEQLECAVAGLEVENESLRAELDSMRGAELTIEETTGMPPVALSPQPLRHYVYLPPRNEKVEVLRRYRYEGEDVGDVRYPCGTVVKRTPLIGAVAA